MHSHYLHSLRNLLVAMRAPELVLQGVVQALEGQGKMVETERDRIVYSKCQEKYSEGRADGIHDRQGI